MRGIISFITLLIFARILGKQQVSELTFFDYILGITIGSIAASLTTDLSSRAWPHWIWLATWTAADRVMKMGRFFLAKIIPALTLAIFILLMNSGTFLKNLSGPTDHVLKYFSLLQASIHRDQWPEAADYLKKMQSAWRKVVPRIQFNEERDEINNFQHNLA